MPADDATPNGPDAIWAPWRLPYLENVDELSAPRRRSKGTAVSFLADYWQHPDEDESNHVIVRNSAGMVLLNRYPYSNGHLLVALGDARPRLLDYEPSQRASLWSLVEEGMDLLERALEPQGVNVGINQGAAAGAGVPGHLHVHLVPRWGGDTNFMTTVANVRVIPSALDAMAARLRLAKG